MNNAALRPGEKRLLMLDYNGTYFPASGRMQRDMLYIYCAEEREYAARLSTLIV